MWWGKRKQQSTPLVAGRDRPAPHSPVQPVYSYHSHQAKQSLHEREGRDVRLARKRPTEPNTHFSWLTSWRQSFVYLVCVAVIGLCGVKVLLVVPESRIVVNNNQVGMSLPELEYTQFANREIRSSILNTNKLTLNANGIARAMERRYPEISSVVVAVPIIGNRPIIYTATEQPSFVLETGTHLYSVSSKGYIIAELSASPSSTLIHLRETTSRQPTPGSQYFAASTITFASTIVYELARSKFMVEYIELPTNAPYELDVHITGKAYKVRFNLQADVMQQSGGAVATLQQLGDFPPKEYLDMRVLGRAYYK